MIVNLVLYSNGEPFNTTKKMTIDSVYKFTKKNINIHDYNLEKIKQRNWFKYIKDLPTIIRDGKRDGYYNSWKAFIIKEVYDKMNDTDILYYVDSSQHYVEGFTENIDKLCDIVFEKGFIAGSVGNDIKNNTLKYCDNLDIWNKILPNNNNINLIDKLHVLNSWFILKKNDINTNFINDWIFFTYYKDNMLPLPLVTYHHTVDQSIFNILVHKYKLLVFYCQNIKHNENKNKNIVLNIINNLDNINNIDSYFIYL